MTRNTRKRSLDGRDGLWSHCGRSETRVSVSGAHALKRATMVGAERALGNLLVVRDALRNDRMRQCEDSSWEEESKLRMSLVSLNWNQTSFEARPTIYVVRHDSAAPCGTSCSCASVEDDVSWCMCRYR